MEEIDYHTMGFDSANVSSMNPEAVPGFLDSVYENFLKGEKLDKAGLEAKKTKLKDEIESEEKNKNISSADLKTAIDTKEAKEQEIENLEIEKIEIRNDGNDIDEPSSLIPFVIGAFITILLTFYLFVFYSSSGYILFNGVKPNSLGFINPDVFTDAQNAGGGMIAMIILFPVIFLGLGFLIHDSLEKNKIRQKNGKKKSYITIISLLFITLIADAFIGYKISEGVHENQFNRGVVNDLWKHEMVFSDVNFYLVLVLGFIVYVIWGFLLHFVLSHPYLKSDSEKVKLLIENIDKKIDTKNKELHEINGKINTLEANINDSETKITQKKKDLIGYENGVIPIKIPLLKDYIGTFMGGYQAFVNGKLHDNKKKAEEIINNVITVKNQWVETKVAQLEN